MFGKDSSRDSRRVPNISEKNKSTMDSYMSMPTEQRQSLTRMGNGPKFLDPNPPATGASMSNSNKAYVASTTFHSTPNKI